MNLKKLIAWQTTSGETVRAHGYTVTPQAQSLSVSLPFGGFVWNRPVAVLVERDGQSQRISILDLTRLTQLSIWIPVLLLTVLLWLRSR